ncbi:uncharacterized protein LOC105187055 isoform X2 [Harpegnathos saltator]|uniref:Tyrosine-protein phosphatase non-receptor type 6 n=1 Tax=Harpegnathos saltator TaxID=610380 RepID=E2BVQ9_HARSA|nr:uncharacterized protein LOC105187055 isoform X2 [Harpegnathos saltator]EFN80217.1 Tyrosine-protein phosphatase non-receptor type 6 [Harpegnathos saltator]
MTGGRTIVFALGVCIGTSLLLFGDVLAEELAEASTTPSGRFDYQAAPTPRGAATILTRVSPGRQAQSIGEKDGQNVELTSGEARDKGGEPSRRDAGDDESASQAGEKSDTSHDHTTQTSPRATGSAEQIEDPSSADGSRKPRYGEISAESSGKSISTKAVSERPPRLSRTNELTIATTKPALNDSKQDNKRNPANTTLEESLEHEGAKTVTPRTSEELVGEESSSERKLKPDAGAALGNHTFPEQSIVSSDDKKDSRASMERIVNAAIIGDSSSTSPRPRKDEAMLVGGKEDRAGEHPDLKVVIAEKDATSASFADREVAEDRRLESRDREFTTVRGVLLEDAPQGEKHAAEPATSASEAFDLEKSGDEKGHEGAVSLINDTYVNYRTQAEQEPKAASAGKPAVDPKEEVEVVKDVTHQPILKIVAVANDSAANDSRANELMEQAVVYQKRRMAIGEDKDHEGQRTLSSANDASVEGHRAGDAKERESISTPEAQLKPLETTTLAIEPEQQTSAAPRVIPSPIPQGRTIGFSDVNEFPSIELKSTAATRVDGGLGTTPFILSTEMFTQKPYPYVKHPGVVQSETTTVASPKPKSSGVAEETSAYENTISREESGKKFIVTEASVVIENSIQQQKSDEKGRSEPANTTTESPALASATVIAIVQDEIGPTNETLPDKSSSSVKPAEAKDAPVTRSEEKTITAMRDEAGYDVTGNGITEVSSPASGRGDGEEAKSRADEATESTTAHSASTPKASLFNTDIQTEPEEAMMIRSTLVVTESTIVPVDEDTATEANKSTTSMTQSMESNAITGAVENTTESTQRANVTLQVAAAGASRSSEPSSTTLDPDETSIPTTTSVEFEFVGLTEVASSNGTNTTEKSVQGRTFDEQTMPPRITTTPKSSTGNASTEEPITTARAEDSSELPATLKDETSTTDQVAATINETTEGRLPPETTRSIDDEQSGRTEASGNEVTTSAIDFTDAGTDVETAGVTDDPSVSKDSGFHANVSETSAPGATELPPVTTPPATNVTESPTAPFAPTNILPPKLPTPNSTESPEEEEGTENIQILSQDEITSLVKIIIEGTLQEVCPHLPDLKSALSNVLTNEMDKLVSAKQIVIHQNPCQEPASSSPTPTDVPLTSILVYVVDEDGKFDDAMTKILPNLYKVSHNFPVRIHKFVLVQETDSGNAIAVVVVSSVAFICLVLLAGLLFIMRKRQTRFNYGERCRPVSLDAYSLDSVSAYSSVRRKVTSRTSKRSYGNPTFEDSSAIPSHPLNFAGILSFCNDVNIINEEFSNIPQVSVKIDELPPGTEMKNRYANVIPLPETRVPLERLNNDPTTEYINASYVRGPKNATKYYIACQAPLDSTVTDFWRMIWEQQCKVIIMLTDLVENGVEKCTEYIPPSEVTDCHRLYGDFQVTLKKRETKEKYAISTLHLKNLENNTFREVFHIWYLWPVSGVETDGAGLIAVLLEARALQRGGPGPIVVHCSSGTGRTGTLIALDLGIRQYEITRTVDVPRVVYTIRRDRAGAVQTKEQYAFIYKALNLYATKLAGGVLEST